MKKKSTLSCIAFCYIDIRLFIAYDVRAFFNYVLILPSLSLPLGLAAAFFFVVKKEEQDEDLRGRTTESNGRTEREREREKRNVRLVLNNIFCRLFLLRFFFYYFVVGFDCVKAMGAKRAVLVLCLVVVVVIQQIQCSFWNEIPSRCIYDRTTHFACWNTTFVHPIPLFNDLSYTLQNHAVDIRDSLFQLSVRDLLVHVGTNIENLTLANNSFASSALDANNIFEGGIFFRLLTYLSIHDRQGLQWSQLNGSYFPQLLQLDLSNNGLDSKHALVFDHKFYPKLTHLDLSHNQLKSLANVLGNALDNVETLILAHNPLESLVDHIARFRSLRSLDLSSTPTKQLFSLTLLPYLQTFLCQDCRSIPSWEYEKLLGNCSRPNAPLLTIDLTQSNVHSLKLFNPHMRCIQTLILSDQNLVDSITTADLLSSTNLQRVEARKNYAIDYIHLNIYERLAFIDFSENVYLNQVILRPRSDYTHLQRLTLTHTALSDFSIDFYNTTLKFLHIDVIDLSHGRLETLDFLKYLTFHTLDVSYNRLKIVDVDLIHYRHGMYDLSLMNLLNLSSNEMEFLKINWENESPHTIIVSENNLEYIELHGQSTYGLHLANNSKLALTSAKFHLDLPALHYLDLTSIALHSLENLIYLHHLTNIHQLTLDHNRLSKQHRTLNWQVFYPWRQYLTHLSLRNMSIDRIDAGARLMDYYHLLTVDFYSNTHLKCDCTLQPFIHWLQTPPPPLMDFYEPLQKLLRIDCPISLFDLQCEDQTQGKRGVLHSSAFRAALVMVVCAAIVLVTVKFIDRRMKRFRSRFYRRVYTDADIITLNERHITQRTDGEE